MPTNIKNTYDHLITLLGNKSTIRYQRKWRISDVSVGPAYSRNRLCIERVLPKIYVPVLQVFPDCICRVGINYQYIADALNLFTPFIARVQKEAPYLGAKLVISDAGNTFTIPLIPNLHINNKGSYALDSYNWRHKYDATRVWRHIERNCMKLAADLVHGHAENWEGVSDELVVTTPEKVTSMIIDGTPDAAILMTLLARRFPYNLVRQLAVRCDPKNYKIFGSTTKKQQIHRYELELLGVKTYPHPKKYYNSIKQIIKLEAYSAYYSE